jgi:hypothetical protein
LASWKSISPSPLEIDQHGIADAFAGLNTRLQTIVGHL